jgi:hypothetical protein
MAKSLPNKEFQVRKNLKVWLKNPLALLNIKSSQAKIQFLPLTERK